MFSPFSRFSTLSGPEIVLEQLEERIVLDGAVDYLSCRAELFSAQIADTDAVTDSGTSDAVATESQIDLDSLALETGTEWLQDGTWHYWERNWGADGNGYEFHAWQDGSSSFHQIQWDAALNSKGTHNGFDYYLHRDGSYTYQSVDWDTNQNGYSYDATSTGTFTYEAEQWLNGKGYSYFSDSNGNWQYHAVSNGSDPGDVVEFKSDSGGWYEFTYTWANGYSWTDTSNHLPTAVPFSVNGAEDTPTPVTGWAMTDADQSDTLSAVTITTLPSQGQLKLGSNPVGINQEINALDLNQISFCPDTDWNGTTAFSYKVTDSRGGASQTSADVSVTLTSVNDLPIAQPFNLLGSEDTVLCVQGWAVTDPDVGDGILSVTMTSLPANGTLKLNTNDIALNQVINSADFSGVMFVPTANWNGVTSFTYKATDSQGGIADSPATGTINVAAVNDLPVATAFSVIGDEDTVLPVTGWKMDDVEDGNDVAPVSVAIIDLPGFGSLELNGNAIGEGQVIHMSDFGRVAFKPIPNWNGSMDFLYRVKDSEGSDSAEPVQVTITVSPLNDLPIARPFSVTGFESTTFPGPRDCFMNYIDPADPQDELATITITSLPEHGTLWFNRGEKITVGRVFSVSDVFLITFEPDRCDLYTPNWSGTTSYTYTVTDSQGGIATDPAEILVRVVPLNDGLWLSHNAHVLIDSDSDHYTFGYYGGSLIDVHAADPTTDETKVVVGIDLWATHGMLSFASTNGLNFVEGRASGDSHLSFRGTLRDVRDAFYAGLTFTPDTGFQGAANIAMSATDFGQNGNYGYGSARVPVTTIDVSCDFDPNNDTPLWYPVNTTPKAQSTQVDSPITFTGPENRFQVSSPDDPNCQVLVYLFASHPSGLLPLSVGSFTLSETAGLSFMDGDGKNDGMMQFRGKVPDVNAALDGLIFTPTGNTLFPVPHIVFYTRYFGQTDLAPGSSDLDTVMISLTGTDNQMPGIRVPGLQHTQVNTSLTFGSNTFNEIRAGDPEAFTNNADIEVQLFAYHGALALGDTSGLSAWDGSGTSFVYLKGTEREIDEALEGMQFLPEIGYVGWGGVAVRVDDLGTDGVGGSMVAFDKVDIIIGCPDTVPSNSCPTISSPLFMSTFQDQAVSLGEGIISIFDSVSGDDPLIDLTLKVTSGTLQLGTTNDLLSLKGDGSSSLFLVGTLSQVNTALLKLDYQPQLEYSGPVDLTITVNDLGSQGIGANLVAKQYLPMWVHAHETPGANHLPQALAFNNTGRVNGTIDLSEWSMADPDFGDTLKSIVITRLPTNGTLTVNDIPVSENQEINAADFGNITFTPYADWTGTTTLAYTVADSRGGVSWGSARVSLQVCDLLTDYIYWTDDGFRSDQPTNSRFGIDVRCRLEGANEWYILSPGADLQWSGGPLEVVVVDTSEVHFVALEQYVREDVIVVEYDFRTGYSLSKIVDDLRNISASYGKTIDALAVVAHGQSDSFWFGDNIYTSDYKSVYGEQWTRLNHIMADDGQIQLYHCLVGTAEPMLDDIALLTDTRLFANVNNQHYLVAGWVTASFSEPTEGVWNMNCSIVFLGRDVIRFGRSDNMCPTDNFIDQDFEYQSDSGGKRSYEMLFSFYDPGYSQADMTWWWNGGAGRA